MSGKVRDDDLSLLEKLAKFSRSYFSANRLTDFDPVTGALSNRAALHTDTQTDTLSAGRGNSVVVILTAEGKYIAL